MPTSTSSTSRSPTVSAAGEPRISYFEPAEIEAGLRAHGFSDVRFLTRDAALRQY